MKPKRLPERMCGASDGEETIEDAYEAAREFRGQHTNPYARSDFRYGVWNEAYISESNRILKGKK